jgi:hypothetical protein
VSHAKDPHSPHWSADFVEHVRTVHFSLVAVCLALIGLLQFEKPKDVRAAQNQLQDIKSAIEGWDSATVAGAVRDAFSSAGGGAFLAGPFTGFQIFQHNLMISDSPLIWTTSEETGKGEALSPNDFVQTKIMKKPSSLQEFRAFWNLLNSRPQVWAMDRGGLSDKLVIVKNDGSVSAMTYTLVPMPSGGEVLNSSIANEHQKRNLSDALRIAPPECVYSFTDGQSTMLLPVSVKSKTEVDGQAALVAFHPYWKKGTFSRSFSELEVQAAGKENESFESLASDLAAEAAKPKLDSFEIFGVKFSVESASRWGIALILGIQVYLWIHLYEVSPKLKEGDPGWDVAWIGVYRSVPAKMLFIASTALLPVITIVALGHHAFSILGSHATRFAAAYVWVLYIVAILISLLLSIGIFRDIPRPYGERPHRHS